MGEKKKKKKDILSKKEIKELLEFVENEETDNRQIILYDFKRPNLLSRTQLRSMKNIYDKFVIDFSSQLKTMTSENNDVDVTMHCVDQITYGEFLMSIPSNSWQGLASTTGNSGLVAIEINNSISKQIISELLYSEPTKKDYLTKEEQGLINNFFAKFVFPILEISFEGFETSFNLLEPKDILSPSEIVCMIVLEVIIGNNSGMINFAYPISFNEKIFQELKNDIR